jgi:hypothetical protein
VSSPFRGGPARAYHRPLDPRDGDPPNTWKEIGEVIDLRMTVAGKEIQMEQPERLDEREEAGQDEQTPPERLDEREQQIGPPPPAPKDDDLPPAA